MATYLLGRRVCTCVIVGNIIDPKSPLEIVAVSEIAIRRFLHSLKSVFTRWHIHSE